MKKILDTILLSFLAGIFISLGGTIFLSCDNKVIGSFLFATGLFFVVIYELKLYTGMIGYSISNSFKDNLMLIIVLIGNFLGTLFSSFIISLTRIGQDLSLKAKYLVSIKLNDTWFSILVLSFFCGILMFLAVNTFKKSKDALIRVLSIFISVAAFILCQFEHCIANMFYFSISSSWNLRAVYYILLMILGNSLGGVFIPSIINITKLNKKSAR